MKHGREVRLSAESAAFVDEVATLFGRLTVDGKFTREWVVGLLIDAARGTFAEMRRQRGGQLRALEAIAVLKGEASKVKYTTPPEEVSR